MVNLIYGSFATAVVALLLTEAVALILLLGAQVIADSSTRATNLPGTRQTLLKVGSELSSCQSLKLRLDSGVAEWVGTMFLTGNGEK